MKQSSLLGGFVSYKENGVLWIRTMVSAATSSFRLAKFSSTPQAGKSYWVQYSTVQYSTVDLLVFFKIFKPETGSLPRILHRIHPGEICHQ